MALGFGSGQYVDCGSDVSLDDINTGTMLAWVYPDSLMNCRIADKVDGGIGYNEFSLFDDYGWGFTKERSTDLNIVVSDPLYETGTWNYLGVVFNTSGADGDQKAYRGKLNVPAVLASSYDIQTVGGGTPVSSANGNQYIGNSSTGPAVWYFPGKIAWVAIYTSLLSLEQIRAQQYNLLAPVDPANCVLFMNLGWNGTGTQPDWSGTGNNGTVTSATVADHVPIGYYQSLSPDLSPPGPFSVSFPPFGWRQGVKIVG